MQAHTEAFVRSTGLVGVPEDDGSCMAISLCEMTTALRRTRIDLAGNIHRILFLLNAFWRISAVGLAGHLRLPVNRLQRAKRTLPEGLLRE